MKGVGYRQEFEARDRVGCCDGEEQREFLCRGGTGKKLVFLTIVLDRRRRQTD